MHDFLAVHFSEPAEDGEHDLFGFVGFELLLGLDFVVNETPFE